MNSVSGESLPLGDPPLVEHPTPTGATETAQRLIPFPFTPSDVKLKEKEALSGSNDWFTKHDKNKIDQLGCLDFSAILSMCRPRLIERWMSRSSRRSATRPGRPAIQNAPRLGRICETR